MANETNYTIVEGNLTREPDIRTTASGKKMAMFTVAWSRKIGADGNEETLFLDCKAFDTQTPSNDPREYSGKSTINPAGWLEKFYVLRDTERHGKGSGIRVIGKLRTESWEKDGQKRSKVVLVVNDMEFGTSKAKRNEDGNFEANNGMPSPESFAKIKQGEIGELPDDTELPF